MSRRTVLHGIYLSVLVLAILPLSFAITDPAPGSLAGKVSIVPRADDLLVQDSDAGAAAQALDRFRTEAGGQWWGRLVADSGRASLVSGSGLSLRPAGAAAAGGLSTPWSTRSPSGAGMRRRPGPAA